MLSRILVVLIASMWLLVPHVRAQSTRAQLTTQITSTLPDNIIGAITPSVLRSMFNSMVLSSTCAGSNQILSWNVSLSPICASSLSIATYDIVGAAGDLVAGPTTSTASTTQAVDWLWGVTAVRTSLLSEAGIWSGKVYSGFGFAKKYDSSNNSAVAHTAPNNGVFVYAENAGTNNDVVAVLGDTLVSSANSTGFGANFIARNGAGINGTKLVGAELDVEFASGTTAGAGSAGLYLNVFNVANVGAAIQTGGVTGGTWSNGLVLDGLASTAAGVAPNAGATMDSLLNCGSATFTTACAVFGTKNVSLSGSTGTTGQVPVRQSGGGLAYGSVKNVIPLNTAQFTIVTTALTGFFVTWGSAGESTALALAPVAGSLSDLSIFVNVAPGVGKNLVFTVRANNADTAVTCTINGTNQVCSDHTHSASIAADQSYSVKVVADAGSAPSIAVGGLAFSNP